MKKTISFFFIILIISLTDYSFGQKFSNVGNAGANFLQIPVEPVGAALANANSAHSIGIAGLYWNPSSIAYSKGTEVIISHVDWVADTRLQFLGLTHEIEDLGTIGLSVTAFTMDEMEITTELVPNGTGNYFNAGSYSFGLSFAKKLIDRFSFGGTVKYIYEYIWETNGSAIAFDFGSTYSTDFYNLRIGMRLSNFGSDVTFTGSPIDNKIDDVNNSGLSFNNDPRLDRISESYSLPQSFNIGVAVDPFSNDQHRFTVMSEVYDPIDFSTQIGFGLEYSYNEFVFLRGGYKSNYDEQDFSFGVGLNFEFSGIKSQFDYAYSSFGVLGQINFISLRTGF